MFVPPEWHRHAVRRVAATLAALAVPLALASPGTAQAVDQAGTGGLVRLEAVDVQSAPAAAVGWSPDDEYIGGELSTLDAPVTTGVAGAAPAAVYRTSRHDTKFGYRLRHLKPGATYTLRLHVVEDTFKAAGRRTMNVVANGRTVITGLDPYAVAGFGKAVVRDVTTTADAAGIVRLDLVGTKDRATLAGLEVLRPGALVSPAPPAGLRAAALAARSVHLSWTDDVEAEQYTVYRNGRRIGVTDHPDYLDLAAAPGQTYRYTVIAKGPTYLVSHPSVQVQVTTPTSDAPVATGRYTTRGGVVVDPAGTVFVPLGANLGTPSTASGNGVANGHAAQARAWGWNTVRLTFYASDEYWWTYRAQHGYDALLTQLRQVVAEYRAQGIVVIIDGHDTPEAATDPARCLDQMTTFWRDVATLYKGDSGVWFNLINEPQAINEEWLVTTERLLAAVRGAGATNIAVVDGPVWGQDLGSVSPWFTGARFGYDATMAPRLAARYGNVVLAQHNYGAYDRYTSAEAYGAYADTVKRTGLPLITGETGFTVDGSTTAGIYTQNRDATYATFAGNPARKVGTIVWNGTHNDGYSLKSDGSAFFTGATVSSGLSEMGRMLWALNH